MHSFAHRHHGELGEATAYETRGWGMNLGWRYDLLVWLLDTFFSMFALFSRPSQAERSSYKASGSTPDWNCP